MTHNVRAALVLLYGDSFAIDTIRSDVTVGTSAAQLVKSNARRISLDITNLGGAPIVFDEDFSVTTSKGYQVAPGETATLDWLEDFELVTKQLVAISAVAGQSIHIVEKVLIGTTPAEADV
jgi:hypothetical protein